ncbi:hypothetical protein Lal_00027531 [Lupinus albus]|uniref:Putative Homeobox domain-containing protein n=1 Tax=Lupinus albus TaxID=3870 RepID=A0A6A5MP15_LUPAL|nr:putative Homeobox domain-containing protein [Lupinus albus]KAF1873493.1 hypothetical protein Lal_00027531 [Lupinus albus]
MPSRNSINHNHPVTPRRSERLLLIQQQRQPFSPSKPRTPFNSKLSKSYDSTKKHSNQKSSPKPHTNSQNCTTGLRRSARLNNGDGGLPSLRRSPRFSDIKVPVNEENGKNPSKEEKFSGGSGSSSSRSRKPMRVKDVNQVGDADAVKKNENCVVEEGKVRNGDMIEVGVKRKRNRTREKETAIGWTKEQELALQRAYLVAKPSPHFWKNVAKLVPGKSQQECFDRIHYDHMTPRQSQPRSRAKTITLSPLHQLSLSASKLLRPFDKKVKRTNVLKAKNYTTQKSVAMLLQRHLNIDRDCEGDIFSVLEPNTDLSTNDAFQPSEALSTPKQQKENQGFLKICTKASSSSSHKKTLSRFSGSCITDLASPPVLKQVKNRVLHEKYIHQLRCREAKRKAACAWIQAPITGKISEASNIQKRDVVKAAKVALVSEARDAISKFQHSQANFNNSCSSEEDNNDGIEVECDSQ